jgi:hypothetical protein
MGAHRVSNFLEGMTFNPATGRYIAGLQARVDELEALIRQLKMHADTGSCSRCQQAHRDGSA